MVDEALRIIGAGAGAGEVGFLEPKIGNLVLVREMKVIEDMPQEAHAREGIRLVNLVTDARQIGPAIHQFASHVISVRTRAGILEGAGVGGNSGEKTICDGGRNRPIARPEEAKNQLAGGGLAGGNPV